MSKPIVGYLRLAREKKERGNRGYKVSLGALSHCFPPKYRVRYNRLLQGNRGENNRLSPTTHFIEEK